MPRPMLVRPLHASRRWRRFLVTSRIVLRIRGERVYEVRARCRRPTATLPATPRPAPRARPRSRCSSTAREAVKPDFDAHRRERRGRRRHLPAARGPAARDRARRGARCALLTPAGIAAAPGAEPAAADRRRRATCPSGTARCGDDRLERGPAPRRAAATCSKTSACSRRASPSTPSRRSAPGDRGTAQALERLAALVDGSLVKQTDDRRPVVFSLLAIVREYALGRLKARGDADALRARARRLLRRVSCARLAPELRGTGQADAVAQLGLELPNLRAAVRHLVYTDRLDDAGDFAWSLLIYWWIAGFFSEVRLWMLELLDKEQPISPAHPGRRLVLRAVGRDVAAPLGSGRRTGSASACGCSPRAATRTPRRWRSPAPRDGAHAVPRASTWRRRGSELTEAVDAPARARQHLGRGDHRGLARAAGWLRGQLDEALAALRSRDRDRPGRQRPLHPRRSPATCGRA